MTEQRYNEMLDAVEAIPQPTFDGWKLTKKELDIIASLDEATLDTIQSTLEAYRPQSALDIRPQLAFKAIAVLLSGVPGMKKALEIGYAYGAEM